MLDSERLYEALLEAAPDAIVGVDERGIIQLVNAQTELLFGYRRDELLGHSIEALVPEGARAVHPTRRAHYLQDPQPRPMGAGMALSARRIDGTTFPAEISLSAIPTDDGLLVFAAVRNVSERVEAEAERTRLRAEAERERLESRQLQSQRLESLGQMAGGVAHDFNNLLGAIMNYATFVGEELEQRCANDPTLASTRDDVAQIQRAAERGAELTRQLLAFGRREVVQARVVNLNTIVSGVEQLLRRTIGEHVELTTSLDANLADILADPGQVEQVLVNLSVNSRDAMPTGGLLEISTSMVEVDEVYAAGFPGMTHGRFAVLRIIDTGVGMHPDVLQHVFEPFFTTKPKGEGTGLGLATVYGIVRAAGGFVQVYSEVGFGTTITVLWPATEIEDGEAQPAPSEPSRSGGATILIVEDEPAMRDVVQRILERGDFKVLVAANGEEALRIAATPGLQLDVVLTDVIMPQMMGQEVASRVSALQPAAKVLYMSGYAQPLLDAQGTIGEGVALIEKPFTAPALLNKLAEVLNASPEATA